MELRYKSNKYTKGWLLFSSASLNNVLPLCAHEIKSVTKRRRDSRFRLRLPPAAVAGFERNVFRAPRVTNLRCKLPSMYKMKSEITMHILLLRVELSVGVGVSHSRSSSISLDFFFRILL